MSTAILVVDDTAVFRTPIMAILKMSGYEAWSAGDGVEALEVLGEHKVGLILLDVTMPRMDGLEFLERLRGIEGYGELPVILLTAMGDRERLEKAEALGVRDYLLKSQFSLTELMKRVRGYVGEGDVKREE